MFSPCRGPRECEGTRAFRNCSARLDNVLSLGVRGVPAENESFTHNELGEETIPWEPVPQAGSPRRRGPQPAVTRVHPMSLRGARCARKIQLSNTNFSF